MKKLSKNDFSVIFSLQKEEQDDRKEIDNFFLEIMEHVKPLKNNNKVSNFEYKQLKNLFYNKDAQDNINDNFKINHLSRKDLKNIKNHKKKVDASLDLHGETSLKAEALLNNFVKKSYLQGKRLIIVVTGKGNNSIEKQEGVGILKAMFLRWVNDSIALKYVVSFSNANPTHGGDGAYYLVLRKNPNF